jgi:hypothetical protein
MSLNFAVDLAVDDSCPRRRKPIKLATIEPHPTRADRAFHSIECASCGYVRTKVLSFQPGDPAAELAA